MVILTAHEQFADPCDRRGFERSKLDLSQRRRNAPVLALHRDLLRLSEDAVFSRQCRQIIHGAVRPRGVFIKIHARNGRRSPDVNQLGRDIECRPATDPPRCRRLAGNGFVVQRDHRRIWNWGVGPAQLARSRTRGYGGRMKPTQRLQWRLQETIRGLCTRDLHWRTHHRPPRLRLTGLWNKDAGARSTARPRVFDSNAAA